MHSTNQAGEGVGLVQDWRVSAERTPNRFADRLVLIGDLVHLDGAVRHVVEELVVPHHFCRIKSVEPLLERNRLVELTDDVLLIDQVFQRLRDALASGTGSGFGTVHHRLDQRVVRVRQTAFRAVSKFVEVLRRDAAVTKLKGFIASRHIGGRLTLKRYVVLVTVERRQVGGRL